MRGRGASEGVGAFLRGLRDLCGRHGATVGGCGCCGSPWVRIDGRVHDYLSAGPEGAKVDGLRDDVGERKARLRPGQSSRSGMHRGKERDGETGETKGRGRGRGIVAAVEP